MNSHNDSLTGEVMPPRRRSFFEALMLWLHDANSSQIVHLLRVILLILAGYAPFAAINDGLAPFALGLPFLDDLEVPIGVIAAIKIFIDIQKYRSPRYQPRRK